MVEATQEQALARMRQEQHDELFRSLSAALDLLEKGDVTIGVRLDDNSFDRCACHRGIYPKEKCKRCSHIMQVRAFLRRHGRLR